MIASLDSAVIPMGFASTLAVVLGRDDVMIGMWCLYFAVWVVALMRRSAARRSCECALEAVTRRAEQVAEDGGRVSWFEHEIARYDPVKAERVRRRRKRT